MNDYYNDGELCMKFTNEEIQKFLVDPLLLHQKISIIFYDNDDNEILSKFETKIRFISFDGGKLDFYMAFYGHQTSIFILDKEIMFIDDKEKVNYTGSHTYHNVVYEGVLRDKTHEEILKLMYKVVIILLGSQKINIEEKFISQEGLEYPKYDYIIELIKEESDIREIELENILFLIKYKLL